MAAAPVPSANARAARRGVAPDGLLLEPSACHCEARLALRDYAGALEAAERLLKRCVGASSSAADCACARAAAVVVQATAKAGDADGKEAGRMFAQAFGEDGRAMPPAALAVWAALDAASDDAERRNRARKRVEDVLTRHTKNFKPFRFDASGAAPPPDGAAPDAQCAWLASAPRRAWERDCLVRLYALAFAARDGDDGPARALAWLEAAGAPPSSAQGYLALVTELRARVTAASAALEAEAPAPAPTEESADGVVGVASQETPQAAPSPVARGVGGSGAPPGTTTPGVTWWTRAATAWATLNPRERDMYTAGAAVAAGAATALWLERRAVSRGARRVGAEVVDASKALLSLIAG